MATLRESLSRAIRRAFCRAADVVLDAWALVGGTSDNPYNQGYSPFRSGYSLACDRPPPPPTPPTFPPGACPVQYTAKVTTKRNINGNMVDEVVTRGCGFQGGNEIYGPIDGFEIDPATNSVVCKCKGPSGQPRVVGMSNSGGFPIVSFTVDFLTRCDNQEDNCGQPLPPPPVIIPPPPETEPVEFDDPDGNPINIPVTFAFGFMYVDADLNVHVPVDIDIDFDVPINLRADFNLHTGDVVYNPSAPASPRPPGGGGNPRQPDGYEIDNPPPPPTTQPPDYTPPENDEDTVETETILRGVIVRITQLPTDANVWFNSNMPDLYYPRVGNVSFYVRVGNSFAWTEFISVTSQQQIIMCPWEGGALDVKVSWYDGVAGELYPVYRRGEKGYTFSLSPAST